MHSAKNSFSAFLSGSASAFLTNRCFLKTTIVTRQPQKS